MRLILKKRVHHQLLGILRALEKEIRCRGRLCLGRTMTALEAMPELMVRRSSWEARGRCKS
ncbi:MAG: hypothetical protein V1882_03650 [Candidatus Omnitrophota bacterium]